MTGRVRLVAQAAALAVVAGMLALLGWKLLQDENRVTAGLARGGAPLAPAFTLERLDGNGELSLESLRGQVVVLNFWASWCGPCRDEAPILQAAWKRWRGKGVTFVGIDVKDFRADARAFVKRYGVTYPNVYDGKGSMVGRYGVTGYPETYFIDAQGRVRYRIAGPVGDVADLDDGIRRALRV